MLKWFIGPNNEKMLVDKVLKEGLLNDYYPESYLAMCAEERQWKGLPSTTQLINGTRYEYLRLLTPYAIDPSDYAFMITGTRGHAKLEKFAPDGSQAEMSIPSEEITGILDLLEGPKANGKYDITDYKVWGSYKVALALGLKKSKRPAIDAEGNPVFYQRSGKGYTAGDRKMEDVFTPDPDLVDMYEAELQVNRYRIAVEKALNIQMENQRLFLIVRDGGTMIAQSRGIERNTYLLKIKFLDDTSVTNYFERKRKALLESLNQYQAAMQEKYLNIKTWEDLQANDTDLDLLKECAPKICDKRESWSGRRCGDYCPVKSMCQLMGNAYLQG